MDLSAILGSTRDDLGGHLAPYWDSFGGLGRYFGPSVTAVGDKKRARDSARSAKQSVARQMSSPGCLHVMKT